VKAIDSLTIVSTGADGSGASKITNDVAMMVAQIPTLVEALSGVNIADLIKSLPGLQGAASKKDGIVVNGKATPSVTPAASSGE
jgi:ribosomal protein L12E/L44/L45/RPP1/RPP2